MEFLLCVPTDVAKAVDYSKTRKYMPSVQNNEAARERRHLNKHFRDHPDISQIRSS